MAKLGAVLPAALLVTVHALRKASFQEEGNASASGVAAWVAGSYGECISTCGPAKFRTVECRSVDGGVLMMDAAACKGPKPPSKEACVCGGSESCDIGFCPFALPAQGGSDPATASFEEVGCFASPGFAQTGAADQPLDWSCFQWTGSKKCSGGLPFYAKPGATVQGCADFCFGKGLDIFGLEGGSTCRCGASALNTQIWRMQAPPTSLVFEAHSLTQDAACPLKVHRYAGFYEDGGIPASFWKLQESDIEYTDSLVTGRRMTEAQEEDGIPAGPRANLRAPPSLPAQAEMAKAKGREEGPSYERNCWPSNCASGNGPWPTRSTRALEGETDKFKEYVRIPFSFSGFIEENDPRRSVFRWATRQIARVTCINFVEERRLPVGRPYVLVGKGDPEKCEVDSNGGKDTPSRLLMGSCNTMRHKGNVIHELLHVLGMEHTMQRPDAATRYHGHGPHLTVRWDNMDSEYAKAQFLPVPETYMGSARDGPRDPHVGYAEYDFASVMHYPRLDLEGRERFAESDIPTGIPADAVGQRINLADSDTLAINDMYQCIPCASGIGDSSFFTDVHGFKCESWVGEDCNAERTGFFQRKYNAAQMADVRRSCRKACGLC